MNGEPPPAIALEEAQQRLLALAPPAIAEPVPVELATGRYLAEPLLARRTQPAADLSAMDGYAMRADDTAGPWLVVGESAAGHPFAHALHAGEAIRISTGAPMPESGGAMLLQEDAKRDGARLSLSAGGTATSRHIRRQGLDFGQGDTLLSAGIYIGPAQLALAIMGGASTLAVGKKPGLAIIDSGDELASDPANCPPHRIPASNGAMLAALAAPFSAEAKRIGPVADNLGALRASLNSAESADVIVTSGGASVGDHDLVRPALLEWGAELEFWRISVRPGKPLLVARRGQQIILGLPGNPVSSYVTAYLFLLPLLRAMAGATEPFQRPLAVPLRGALPAAGNRTEFLRGIHDGETVTPVDQQDSSMLRTLAACNALIRRETTAPPAADGDLVAVYPLQNGAFA